MASQCKCVDASCSLAFCAPYSGRPTATAARLLRPPSISMSFESVFCIVDKVDKVAEESDGDQGQGDTTDVAEVTFSQR